MPTGKIEVLVAELEVLNHAPAELPFPLEGARADLTDLRARAREEKLPLRNRLSELQKELVEAEAELRRVTRLRNEGAQEFANLTTRVEGRRAESPIAGRRASGRLRCFVPKP